MINIQQLTKDWSGTEVLQNLSFQLSPGEKVGLIGRNGAGKTTLLNLLCGQDTDYKGSIQLEAETSIALVPQYFPDYDGTALEWLCRPWKERKEALEKLEHLMARTEGRELEKILEAYGRIRTDWDAEGGETAEERARRYLEGLGLKKCINTATQHLSGGEKNVLSLASAILLRPSLLILDEPGNHLDLQGISWLESFIKSWPGAVLMVSHNRYLLDRVAERILELEQGKIHSYTGNYSTYRLESLRKTVSTEMHFRADAKKIERMEALVKRFEQICRATADPAWGKRLRSRRTQLARMKDSATEKPLNPDSSFSLSFSSEQTKANIALRIRNHDCIRGNRTLLHSVSLFIENGERVALLGPNGSGKSSFLEDIRSLCRADNKEYYIGPSMKCAWCSQHGETLNPEASILDSCISAGALNREEAWKVLSRFLFTYSMLDQKTGSLSGGEINRLQLALAVIAKANFLILDEPTNHLDISAREAVEDALAEFEGTILCVSHDRYFLDKIATRIIEIDDGGFTEWNCCFTEYYLARWGRAPSAPFSLTEGPAHRKADASRRAGQIASGCKAATDSRDALEKRITSLEKEKSSLEKEMQQAYNDGSLKKARSMGVRLSVLVREIESLYKQWL